MELKRKRNQSDSIMFNGHDLSKLVYCKVRRPIMASVSASFEDAPGRTANTSRRFAVPVTICRSICGLRTEHRREVLRRGMSWRRCSGLTSQRRFTCLMTRRVT